MSQIPIGWLISRGVCFTPKKQQVKFHQKDIIERARKIQLTMKSYEIQVTIIIVLSIVVGILRTRPCFRRFHNC